MSSCYPQYYHPNHVPDYYHPQHQSRSPQHSKVLRNTYTVSPPMPQPHPNYPPLLPRTALLGPLHPYPVAWRDELTNRLQARSIPISRAFLALCNLNLLEYASIVDRTTSRQRSVIVRTDKSLPSHNVLAWRYENVGCSTPGSLVQKYVGNTQLM